MLIILPLFFLSSLLPPPSATTGNGGSEPVSSHFQKICEIRNDYIPPTPLLTEVPLAPGSGRESIADPPFPFFLREERLKGERNPVRAVCSFYTHVQDCESRQFPHSPPPPFRSGEKKSPTVVIVYILPPFFLFFVLCCSVRLRYTHAPFPPPLSLLKMELFVPLSIYQQSKSWP